MLDTILGISWMGMGNWMKVIKLPVISTGDVMHNVISKNSTAVWYILKLLRE